MSVIAHVDHGKSTLTDSLIAAAGIISSGAAGDARYTDTRQDEKDRGITIKSTGVSMYYEYAHNPEQPKDTKGYLINLIDSPGHVDFSSEVTAALRVTDGALVVVDCTEGVCVQTETVLRQALGERVVPCLMLNKVDRVITELQCSGEEAYRIFEKTIGAVNEVIHTFQDKKMPDLAVDPVKGNVTFGAGLQCWGFTLLHFARLYQKKFGGELDYWMKNLWGNHFFNAAKNVWTNKSRNEDGSENQRGFAVYIMDPIMNIFRYVLNDEKKKYKKLIEKMEIKLTAEDEQETGKKLVKAIMKKFLPAAEALLEMMVLHLPSPMDAQKYRAETLYMGPADDECYKAIQACDRNGPLVVYISKMVPTVDRSRFFAFGRVFSGTVATGQKVNIMGPQYVYGKKHDYFTKNIQRTVLMMGAKVEQVDDIPCGNTVGLVGVDQYIIKSGTITTIDDCYPIRPMKFSVSPVVRVAIECVNAKDLPKLQEGMKRLEKSDPCVLCIMDEDTGQNIVAGVGELHLEICLKDLKEDFCHNAVPFTVTEPVVQYRETITAASER